MLHIERTGTISIKYTESIDHYWIDNLKLESKGEIRIGGRPKPSCALLEIPIGTWINVGEGIDQNNRVDLAGVLGLGRLGGDRGAHKEAWSERTGEQLECVTQ